MAQWSVSTGEKTIGVDAPNWLGALGPWAAAKRRCSPPRVATSTAPESEGTSSLRMRRAVSQAPRTSVAAEMSAQRSKTSSSRSVGGAVGACAATRPPSATSTSANPTSGVEKSACVFGTWRGSTSDTAPGATRRRTPLTGS